MVNEKIVISKVNDKKILIHFVDDKPVLIRPYNFELNDYFTGVIVNCRVIKKLEGVKGCFIKYDNDKVGFVNGDFKCETVLPLMFLKDGINDKKPLFTNELEIAGRFCVVKYNNACDVKCSSKLPKINKVKLKEHFENVATENNFTLLFRTLCKDYPIEVIEREVLQNIDILSNIINKACSRVDGHIFYKPLPPLMMDISEIIKNQEIEIVCDDINDFELIKNAKDEMYFGGNENISIRLYEDNMLALYKLYRFESIISECLSRKIYIKDNATITFDQTEALVAIDVNSASATYKKLDKEESDLKVNMYAAKEAIRHIILRNYSGIIIIDFINMESNESYNALKDTINNSLSRDNVKSKFHGFTKLGLAEISRQKKEASFFEKMRS